MNWRITSLKKVTSCSSAGLKPVFATRSSLCNAEMHRKSFFVSLNARGHLSLASHVRCVPLKRSSSQCHAVRRASLWQTSGSTASPSRFFFSASDERILSLLHHHHRLSFPPAPRSNSDARRDDSFKHQDVHSHQQGRQPTAMGQAACAFEELPRKLQLSIIEYLPYTTLKCMK